MHSSQGDNDDRHYFEGEMKQSIRDLVLCNKESVPNLDAVKLVTLLSTRSTVFQIYCAYKSHSSLAAFQILIRQV